MNTVKARIEWPVVRDENGKVYSFLGSGARYGFDSAYAVAEQGVIQRRILQAETLPWPYADNEISITLNPKENTQCKLLKQNI